LRQAFISYSHADHHEFNEFQAALKPVARAFNIDIWADKRLRAGQYWNQKIADAIEASNIHVLLMSIGFFSSDYIFDHELPAIAHQCRLGALTIPVLVERCYWSAFVGVLQAVPMNERGRLIPIKEWKPTRNGHSVACEQIAGAIKDHLHLPHATLFDWGKP
jgi:hypothetical protein